MNTIDYFRNNMYCNYAPHLPINYFNSIVIDEQNNYLSVPVFWNDKYIYINQGGIQLCLDGLSKKIKWKKNTDKKFEDFYYVGSVNDKEILLADDNMFYIDKNNTENIVNLNGEYIYAITDKYVLTGNDNNELISVKDIKSLQEIWTFESRYGHIGKIVSDKDTIVVKAALGVFAFDVKKGKLLWELESKKWIEENFPIEMNIWIEDKNNRGPDEVAPSHYMGPLIDDFQYVSWRIGVVAAIHKNTGQVVWTWRFPNAKRYAAKTIIYRKGRLYFVPDAPLKNEDLYCLDALTGKLIYESKIDYFDGIISNPVLADKYFIGGTKNHIIAFDVEDKKLVWSYKHDRSIFGNQPIILRDSILIPNSMTKSLYWFK